MSDQEEIKQQEEPQVNQDPPEETVGDIMQKAAGVGIKFWLILVSVLVYIAGVVYAEVHGLTMLQKGVAPDMQIWAQLGMIAAGITALALPAALKVWTIEAKQRIGTYIFYVLDFAFLAFNAFTDFNTNTGQQLAPWAQAYVTYILPASPIVVALGWAIIWELDPAVKAHILALSLRAAMKEKMARKVADAAKGAKVNATINAAAEQEVDRALFELFGARPAAGYYVVDEPQRPNLLGGLLKSFFGYVSQLARAGMPSQPQDSPSDQPTPAPQDPPNSP